MNVVCVGRAANQTLPPNQNVSVIWDTPVEDALGAWSPSQPTRVVVPVGFTRARAVAAFHLSNRPDYARAVATIARNGSWGWGHQHITFGGAGRFRWRTWNPATSTWDLADWWVAVTNDWAPQAGLCTRWLPVVSGDYFELKLHQTNWENWPNTPANAEIVGGGAATWLEVEFQ
jgi:hypothetical protein